MAVKDDTPITRGLFSGFEMGGGGYAPGQFFPSQVDYGTKPSDITAGMEVRGFQELDKTVLHQKIISGDIKFLGGDTIEYEGIDVPLTFIYGALPGEGAYYEVGDLDGDGENEVFTARTEQGGGETVIDVRSVSSGDDGPEVQTVSYDDFVAQQQQQDDFTSTSGSDILSEMGEGGGCQRPNHVPIFIDGMPSGCASITYFDDYFDPGGADGGPTIQVPSFESIYGELPEGATTWQIGDFDGDGVREVYAMDADGNPHTVYGYDDSGNVTSSPYSGDGTSTEPTGLEEYYEVFGEGLVNDVIDKMGDFIDKAQDAVDDPLGALKNILDNVLPAAKDCESWTDPCTSGGNPCWKDCVQVGLIFGIPGLPMPPGMIGATVRDIENAVKEIGKDIGDFIEDPLGTIDEIIDDTVEKIQGVFSSGSDPQGIYDWIKGILGNVIGGIVWNTIGDTIDELFVGGDDNDPQTQIDCTQLDEFNANRDYCLDQGFVNCDELTSQSGNQLTGGIQQGQENCEEIQDPKCIGDGIWNGEKCVCPDGSDKEGEDEPLDGDCSDGDTQTPQQICEDKGLTYDPNNENADEDGCADTGDDGGTTDTDINCSEPVSVNPSLTYGDRLNAYRAACPNHCPDSGTLKTDHVNDSCYMSLKEDCENVDEGSTDTEKALCGYQQCPEDTEKKGQLVKDINTDCGETIPDCSEINEGNYQQCEKVKCPDGKFNTVDGSIYADSVEDCVGRGGPDLCPDGSPKANHENGDCDAGCVKGYVNVNDGNGCVPACQIPGKEGFAAYDEDNCVEDPVTCDDPQANNYGEEGECTYDPPEICDDPQANNYGDKAECTYDPVEICEDPQASNYGEEGFCVYDPVVICQDPQATNYGEEGECEYAPVVTCDDPQATNYGEEGECQYAPVVTCDDPQATNYGEEGECEYAPIVTCDDPQATNYGEEGECTYAPVVTCDDPAASNYGEEGECTYAPIVTCDDPAASNYGEEGECTYGPTVCDNGATIESGCQECPSGQDFDADGNCGPVYTCDDPNATVQQGGLTPGACGPCKEGYVFDGAVERCVQESTPNPCDNPAYAAANPTECGTTTPCNDCNCAEYAAANPDECGTTPPPPEGGGGGGGGMFRPQAVAPMGMGDPQLLARLEFPIVDYLSESLAKQTKDDLMSGMLTGNIV